MGVIGILAGVLFQKRLLRRTHLSLTVFGAIAAILVFGGILNPASATGFFSLVSLPSHAGKARPHQGEIRAGGGRRSPLPVRSRKLRQLILLPSVPAANAAAMPRFAAHAAL